MGLGTNCRRICLSTNLTCNLNCRYCYERKNDKTVIDVEKTINQLYPILSKKTKDGTRIKLHGGEPFMEFDIIKSLCERLWTLDISEELHIHMTTNGTLVHGEIQKWLTDHKDQITLKLSLDGDRRVHNINRPNSFDKIDIDFFRRTWPDINIKMTISPWTIQHFSESVIALHNFHFRNISPSFAEMVSWDSSIIDKVFYIEMTKLGAFYLAHPDIDRCSFFKIDISRVNDCSTEYHPCTIGTKCAYDYHTERYYPCHLYFESTAGKIKSEQLLDIDLSDQTNRVSDECSDCLFVNLCHTCFVANFLYRGATNKRDKALCSLQKMQFLAVAEFEYTRIINKSRIDLTTYDYKCMMAIKSLMPEIELLKKQLGK